MRKKTDRSRSVNQDHKDLSLAFSQGIALNTNTTVSKPVFADNSINECRQAVDQASKSGKKICYWSDAVDKRVVCDAKDNKGQCGGNQCSNGYPNNLAKYALCTNTPVCG